MNEIQPRIHTERVDDTPLLLAHMLRLNLPAILDAHFPVHGNHRGLSRGWITTLWLAHLLSRGDHRLNRVRPWADQRQTTLNAFLPTPLRATDVTDDRLSDVLAALSHDAPWAACEEALNGHILRVYDLTPTVVRADSSSASGYWRVTPEGLFQFGHSKDHRPDLPQLKVMLATLDPLGMPLAVDVAPGQRSDEPLYRPIIDRVRASLQRTGLLYVGDSKLGALALRAHIHQAGDHYLCPLGLTQLPAAALDALVTQALTSGALVAVHPRADDDPSPTDAARAPVVIAEAWETSVELHADTAAGPVAWTERRVVVRSSALQARQGQALERRLAAAEAEVLTLLPPRRGKRRPRTPAEAEAAIAAIVARHQVAGLLDVRLTATAQPRLIRATRARPARTDVTYAMTLTVARVAEAITAAVARLGWRVYGTNRPAAALDATQVVHAYRAQYLVEQSIARLKGAPLSLSPVYLSRDDHVVGMVRLLTLALRVLSLLETGIRQRLAQTPAAEPLTGLYAGQPNRATWRPTAERVLEAFRDLTLTVVELPTQVLHHLTPLTGLQRRLLALAGLDETCYTRLVDHASKPP